MSRYGMLEIKVRSQRGREGVGERFASFSPGRKAISLLLAYHTTGPASSYSLGNESGKKKKKNKKEGKPLHIDVDVYLQLKHCEATVASTPVERRRDNAQGAAIKDGMATRIQCRSGRCRGKGTQGAQISSFTASS